MADDKGKPSDLGPRFLSAVVMAGVAASVLWLGGAVWAIFVLLVGAGVWLEWNTLVNKFTLPGKARTVWLIAGVVYCGIGAAVLQTLRDLPQGLLVVSTVLLAVIATDVGAYFTGRTFGGPKLAPRISPSKTWSGLAGGVVLSGLTIVMIGRFATGGDAGSTSALTGAFSHLSPQLMSPYAQMFLGGVIAVIAQTGDLFQSQMKRRAGVKDSGNLIPGHGGLFDRLDGLLAVVFVFGVLGMIIQLSAIA